MTKIRKTSPIHTVMRPLASLRLTVACLMLLFILTFWGTVAQVNQGLYAAQNRYFYSLFFLIKGVVPFPGAQGVLWVLFINLLAATVIRFQFRWSKAGILIIHGGLLLFFVAAFVTFHGAKESQLTLQEGAASNAAATYHDWELAFWPAGSEEQRSVVAYDVTGARAGDTFRISPLGLDVRVDAYYPHSEAYTQRGDFEFRGRNDSGVKALAALGKDKAPEQNTPGGVFHFQAGQGQKGDTGKPWSWSDTILLYGGEVNPTVITVPAGMGPDDAVRHWAVQLRRKRHILPFTVTLKDFRMERHPNTEMARSYESLVEVRHHDLAREVLIQMNEPLRFKNYTLYQASYSIDRLGRERSTLAVVRNSGRILPYVASFVTFAGLLWHFFVTAWFRRQARPKTGGAT